MDFVKQNSILQNAILMEVIVKTVSKIHIRHFSTCNSFVLFTLFKVKLPKIVLFQILQMENVMMDITHLIVIMITENAVVMLICPFALNVFAKTLQILKLEVMYFF